MRFTWKKRKLLKRYIITYVLVFAVPLVVFSYIIYQQSVKRFSQQYIETSQTAAKGVSIDLARLLDLAESTANSVRGNPYFSSSSIKDFAGSFIYIDQRMSELSSLNKDFFEIAFYSDESGLVYTSSTYEKKFYFEHIFCSSAFSAETDFYNISASQWIPMQPVETGSRSTFSSSLVIPVERRIENGKRTTTSVLIAHLEIERIRQLLSPVTAIPDTHVVAFYNGTPILADDFEILQYFLQKEPENLQNTTLSVCDASYFVKWDNPSAQISVLTLLPQKNIKFLASDILKTYLLSLLLSALIGVSLVFFSVRQSYQPILRLFQKAARATGPPPEDIQTLDEVGQASYAFDNLVESKTKAETAHWKIKLKHVLLRLLENSSVYCCQPSFANHLKELKIDFSAKSYCCILFSQCADRDLLARTLLCPPPNFGGKLFCTGDLEETSSVALLCCEEACEDDISNVLKQVQGLYSCAGIGNFVSELSNVTLSYKQAYHALITNGENPGIHEYSHLRAMKENDILAQFSKETELFSSAVAQQEESKMRLSLSRIADLLELIPTKGSVAMLLHHLLFVAVKGLAAANISFTSTVDLFENIAQPYKATAEKEWLQAFSTHLSSLLGQRDKCASSFPANDCVKDIQYALLYINSNYSKETFSIKQLADDMGMSISNLSHFFKNKTNKNISYYINELRITEAKRLLRETDLKIAEIFPLIGYSHASSLTKSFKKSTGKTPSQYKSSVLR